MRRLGTALFVLLLTSGSAFAQTTWTGFGAAGQWDDALNWDNGSPAGQAAIISTAGVTITSNIALAAPTSLTVTGGSLTINDPGQTLTVTGAVTITGATDSIAIVGGTIAAGTNDITGSGVLNLQSGPTLTAGSMTVSTVRVIGTNSPTFNITGNWGVTTFIPGRSTVSMLNTGGAETRTISNSTTFWRLSVAKSGAEADTVRASGAVTVTVDSILLITGGVFEVNAGTGMTLTGSAGSYDSLVVSANGRLLLLGTGGFPAEFEAANLQSGSTVIYGGGAQSIAFQEADGGTLAYSILSLTGSGTKTALGGLDVNGNFVFSTAGVTFDLGSFTHLFSSATWSATAGTITAGTSTINFDGGTQSITSSAGSLNNVTFSGSFITLAAALTASGNANISGTLDAAGFDMTVGGDWVRTGTFTSNSNRVIFNGAAQNIAATTFSRVWVQGSGTKTATGGLTIGDTLRVYSGATLDLGANVHVLSGNVELLNGTSSILSTGTIQFNNSANIFIDVVPNGTAGALNNITLLNTGRIDIVDDSIVFNGNVTIGNTSFLRIDGTGNFSCNNLVVNGTLDIYGSRSFPGAGGTISYSQTTPGSFTEGRVRYSDGSDQTISASVSGCYNLEVDNAGTAGYFTKTAAGNLTVNYRIIVGEDGGGAGTRTTLNMGAFDLVLTNNLTINASDTLVSNAKFNHLALASEYAELTLVDAGSTARLFRYIVTQLATPADGRELTIRVTGAGASLQISKVWDIQNPAGADYALFEMELATSTNVTMTGAADSLIMGANCWMSSAGGTGAETNIRDLLLTVENVSLDAQSGFSYYSNTVSQTIAAYYNGGVTQLPYQNLHLDNDGPGTLTKTAEGPLDINGFFVGNGDGRFVDAGFSHTVAGNLALQNQTPGDRTGTLTLDGAVQSYSNNDFFNVVFAGTGIKSNAGFSVQVPAGGNDQTINVGGGAINVDNSVTISSGVTVDGGTYAWTVANDWTNNGGIFQHTGTVTFDGTTDQVFNGQFNNITFANTTDTTWAGGAVSANTVTFNANSVFADSGKTINVTGNWVRTANPTRYVATGTVNFSGTSVAQTVNINSAPVFANLNDFNNIIFSGAAAKSLTANGTFGLDVAGNLTIRVGSGTVNLGAYYDSVAGNYVDSAGTLSTTGRMIFDGTSAQSIGAEQNFFRIEFNNAGTKTLAGNIRCGILLINTNATLDVSSSNYAIEVTNALWQNSGTFVPQQGTVSFTGTLTQTFTTGGTGAGKALYNLTVNKSGTSTVLMTASATVSGNLTIGGLSVTAGLDVNGFDINVGGNYSNSGGIFDLTSATTDGRLTLNATSGPRTISGSGTINGPVIINAPSVTYSLLSNVSIGAGRGGDSLSILAGSLNLNTKKLTVSDSIFVYSGATLTVNKFAILELGSGADVIGLSGSTIAVVGQSDSIATVTSTGGANRYDFQTSGNIQARYYKFDNMTMLGIQLNSGSVVDSANNFSDGQFTNGAAAGRYLLYSGEASGYAATNTDTIRNVVFNVGPSVNVQRLSGTDIIVMKNTSGSVAGPAFETDSPDGGALTGFIRWVRDAARWTAAGGTSDWFTGANWNNSTIPSLGETVEIDTVNITLPAFKYISPEINAPGAQCGALVIENDSLRITGTGALDMDGALSVQGDAVMDIQNGATINMAGGISVSGTATFNKGTSTIIFDAQTGSHNIDMGGDSLNNVTWRSGGGTWTLLSAMAVRGNFLIDSGTVDVGASAYAIGFGGDWKNSGTFTHQTGTVTFRSVSNQALSGTNNSFYNVVLDSAVAGTRTITWNNNVDINNTITFGGSNIILDARDKDINVGEDWLMALNKSGIIQFRNFGTGTLTFDKAEAGGGDNSAISQQFQSTDSLNNVIFSSSERKELVQNGSGSAASFNNGGTFHVKGNFTIAVTGGTGTDIVDINSSRITGNGPANTLSVQPSSVLRLMASAFPDSFETVDLDPTSQVRYDGRGGGLVDTIETNSGTIVYSNLILQTGNTRFVTNGDLYSRSMTVNDTVTLDLDRGLRNGVPGNNNLEILVDLNQGGTGTRFDTDSSTVTFSRNDGAAVTIPDRLDTVGNFVINGVGDKDFFDSIYVMGDVTVGGGATIDLNTYNIIGVGGSNTMSAGPTSRFEVAGPFFNTFETVNIDPTNTTVFDGGTAQNLPAFTYGNLEFDNGSGTPDTARGAINVRGYLRIFNDGGFVTGAFTHQLEGNFTLDNNGSVFNSTGSTFILNGADQSIIRTAGGNVITFGGVQLSGSGTKTLDVDNDMTMTGSFTIDSSIVFDKNNEDVTIGGDFTSPYGVIVSTGGTFTFNGTNQTIDPGTNTYNIVSMAGSGTKTFSGNGMLVGGTFTIGAGVTVDFDSLNYEFGNTWTNGGNPMISAGSRFTFNTGTYTITPVASDTFPSVTIAGTGTRTMGGAAIPWVFRDTLTINNGSTLTNATNNNTVWFLTDYLNSGTYTAGTGLVNFSASSGPRTIQTNGSAFDEVRVYGGGVTYQLTSTTSTINGPLRLFAGTFDLNGRTLNFGNAVTDSIVVGSSATLDVDDNAFLNMDNGTVLNAESGGTARFVGSSGNVANVSVQSTTTDRYRIFIQSGATVHARFYRFEYMDSINVLDGSTTNPTNNFSDGAFSNGLTNGVYLVLADDFVGTDTLRNVTFNSGATFNVSRPATLGEIVFKNYSGILGGATYEKDPLALIKWEGATFTQWTGASNSNWHVVGNWSAGIPNDTIDALIVSAANNPVIGLSPLNASARTLTIRSGAILTIGSSPNFQDLTIGTGGLIDSGTVVMAGADTIRIAGDWIVTNNFVPGSSGVVIFNGLTGTQTIDMPGKNFRHVRVEGTSTVLLGDTLVLDGDFTVVTGSTFDVNGYNMRSRGNWTVDGTFLPRSNQVTFFNGSGNVNIDRGSFSTLAFDDSTTFAGTRTITDTVTVSNRVLMLDGQVTGTAPFNVDGTGIATSSATAAWVIGSGVTFNAGSARHTLAGGIFNQGTWSGTGILAFDGGTVTNINNAATFGNVEIAGTGTKTLGGSIVLNNLDITSGTLSTSDNGWTVTAGGGSDTLTMLSGTTYDNRASFSGFESYYLDVASTVNYSRNDQNIVQTIIGLPPGQSYGILALNGAGTRKTATGDLVVSGNLLSGQGGGPGVKFDMNNFNLNVGGNLTFAQADTFVAGIGDLTMDGSGTQTITLNVVSQSDSSNLLYKLTVTKPANSVVNFAGAPHIRITNNLTINGGILNIGNNQVYIGGSLVNQDSLQVGGTSIVRLIPTTGSSVFVNGGGSILDQLEVNSSGSTFTQSGPIIVRDNFTFQNGIWDMNGQVLQLGQDGGNAEAHSIDGELIVGPGSILRLSSNSTLTANASSTVRVVGTAGNFATVTRITASGYGFSMLGDVYARYYAFEYMGTNGIVVNAGADVDSANNFSDGSFNNGTSGGTLFRIETSENDTIRNVAFPTNPGGGASNVSKVLTSTGVLVFDNFSGAFGGELFDNDPFGDTLIVWLTPDTLFWDGSGGTDWYTATNWTPNVGPERVPDSLAVVVIPNTVNKPSIDSNLARAKELIIESGARLNLNGGSLQTEGKIDFTGILQVNNSTDSIRCGGAWNKGTGGTYTNGGGTVIFTGTGGSLIQINCNSNFQNVRFSGNSSFQLQNTLTVLNDLTVNAGTLVTNNFQITVGGNYYNGGAFTAGTGTFIMNASSGTKTVTPGGAGNAFNNLTFSGAATFQLASAASANGNVSVNAGTLQLNSQTFNMGNGADALTVASGATLDINANANLRMASGASITVNGGGTIRIVGSDASNVATITRQSSGTYAATINGTVHAQYYLIEYLNTTGLNLGATAVINSTNNFSNGTFANGAPSGTYLTVAGATTIPATPFDTLLNVVFNNPTSGAITNVNHTSGDTLVFKDASGPYAGSLFENDSPDGGDNTGKVHWTFSVTQITWTGAVDSSWKNPSNWSIPTVPDFTYDVIVPNVSRKPIIDTLGKCRNLTINSSSRVLMRNGDTLIAQGSVTINTSGVLEVTNGSPSVIYVGNQWTNLGTFTAGNLSTVILNSNSGTRTITDGTSAFHHLRIDSGATYNLSSPLEVNGDLTLNAGTLNATASNYRINLGGDWKNFGGAFTSQSDSVIFDDADADTLYAGSSSFYRVVIAKTGGGSVTVRTNDVTISDFLSITNGTLFGGSNNITVSGNWTVGLGTTFSAQTGTVTLTGAGIHSTITRGNAFENLVINKTGGGQITVSDSITVNGILNVTAGTLYFNNRAVRVGNGVGTDTIRIAGVANLDAGSNLRMHETVRGTVISGGTLQVVGNNTSSRATVTSTTGNAGWQMDVAGTIHSRFAYIRYSGGSGIQVLGTGTINSLNDFSYTDFSNGTGIAYLTIANGQNLSPDSTRFDSTAASRTLYNVNYTGSGTVSFVNYKGTMSGVNYENDNGGPSYGNVRWSFNETQTVSAGSATFGNDAVFSGVGNLGSTNVVLVSDTLPEAILAVARWYEIQATSVGTGTGSIRLSYGEDEVQAASQSNLRIWRRRNGLWTRLDSISGSTTTRDTTANWVQFSPYVFAAGVRDTFVLSDALFESSLPVALVYFRGVATEGGVRLEWRTESEIDNAYWLVQRREVSQEEADMVSNGGTLQKGDDAAFATLERVRGQGTKPSATDYSQFDPNIEAGKHYAYRLADVSSAGAVTHSEEILIMAALPKEFALRQNFPNPFNPSTTIRFELPVRAKVSIRIYNILGQEVYELANREFAAGFHGMQWNGINAQNRAVASGVYIYRVVAQSLEGKERFVKTRKMMLVK